MDYLTFFRGLSEEKVDYVLVGGLAVNFHGIPRMTYDIDIIILLDKENVDRLIDLMEKWGYTPRIPEEPSLLADKEKRDEWRAKKGMMAFTFWSDEATVHEVDVVFDYHVPYERFTPALRYRVIYERNFLGFRVLPFFNF